MLEKRGIMIRLKGPHGSVELDVPAETIAYRTHTKMSQEVVDQAINIYQSMARANNESQ